MTFFASLRRFYDDYVQFLVDQRRPEEALVIAELSRARLLRERLSRPDVPARSSVAAFLAAARALDAVVLSYWTGRQRSWLWVVGPAGVRIHALPGEAELRRDVEDYQRRVLLSRDPLAERPPEGERLWRALLAPAQREVARSARVVLVPDGPLHQLNFETLPVPGAAPRYWIEDATVLTAPSLSLVSPRTAKRTAPPALLLAIGDPIPAGPEFPRLAHAADELREVARGFGAGRATVITGADAVPAAYLDARPERFGFIHFAAHVTANRESPLDSAIVLAPREEAYKLYARDVVGVPLAAELVTLSACRSAGARALAGEGLVGLSWSFLSAGAGNVVGGLWNVEDASSASLMAALYRGVGRGADPAVALRDAKLALLRSGTAYRKPFYWGAFVIYTRSPRPPR
jgi:CHAT domain-containing protein